MNRARCLTGGLSGCGGLARNPGNLAGLRALVRGAAGTHLRILLHACELGARDDLEGLSKEEKRARKAKQRAREDRIYTVSNILLKQDEDYTKRRRIWWAVLAIGMVLVVAIGASLYFAPGGTVSSPVQMVGIVLSYVIILGDFIYDFARIRPLRNMYRAQAEGMSENKLNALIERAAAEEDKKDSKKK